MTPALLLLLACTGDTTTDSDTPTSDSDTAATGATDTGPDDGRLTDAHSMPREPTLSLDDFASAETCRTCHPDHVAEWETSNHAYAMVDPVFRGLVGVRQADFGGAQDAFCNQCHSAIGVRSGDLQPGFSYDELDPLTLEGVTCDACHKVTGLAREYNSGHILDGSVPQQGPWADSEANAFHESASTDLLSDSAFCGACHDVIEVSGLNLERPYEEWLESPSADAGETCQDCHMPTRLGEAVPGGPERTLREHKWIGVDVPLAEGFLTPEQEVEHTQGVKDLLEGAAEVRLDLPPELTAGDQLDLVVTIENRIQGHSLPTGSTFLRQCWLEVTVTDDAGRVVYVTGDLDDHGDLRNHWSELDPYGDDDLISLSSTLIDERGNPTLFPWKAAEHTSFAISPGYDRTWTLFVPTTGDLVGPLSVSATLRFRSHPPYLLRLLGLDELVDRIDIHDIASDDAVVQLSSDGGGPR